jgi:hypothetical protein
VLPPPRAAAAGALAEAVGEAVQNPAIEGGDVGFGVNS